MGKSNLTGVGTAFFDLCLVPTFYARQSRLTRWGKAPRVHFHAGSGVNRFVAYRPPLRPHQSTYHHSARTPYPGTLGI